MKPLIRTIPLVGGLQIYFLNNPNIDFNLVGVADLLDMPGLRYEKESKFIHVQVSDMADHLLIFCRFPSDMLRRIIVEQVSAMMVLPNKLPIVLSNTVSQKVLKFPEPQVW